MSPGDECSPARHHSDEATCTTRTGTDQDAQSAVESTAALSDVDLGSHAAAYARAGLAVLPLHSPVGVPGAPLCPCRRPSCGHACSCLVRGCESPGKHPRTLHGAKDASTDPEVVASWWQRWSGANIGVVPGEGIVVVDVDPRDDGALHLVELKAGRALVPTWTCWTGGGGLHAWFRAPGPYRGKLARGVDLKCSTGFLVAPPSLHKAGPRYSWANELPVAVAPDWLAELMVASPPVLRTTCSGSAGGAADDGLVRTVATAPTGERNAALHWGASRAVERGAPPELLARLAEAARGNGLGDPARGGTVTLPGSVASRDEVDRTIGSALSRAGVPA